MEVQYLRILVFGPLLPGLVRRGDARNGPALDIDGAFSIDSAEIACTLEELAPAAAIMPTDVRIGSPRINDYTPPIPARKFFDIFRDSVLAPDLAGGEQEQGHWGLRTLAPARAMPGGLRDMLSPNATGTQTMASRF